MNQKNLFHAIQQAVHQNDFAEGLPSTESFDPPLESASGKAMFEGRVERFKHGAKRFGDGFSNGGAHHGEQRIGENVRVPADRLAKSFLDGGSQSAGQGAVATLIAAHGDGFGDHGANVLGAASEVFEAFLNVRDVFLLGRDD